MINARANNPKSLPSPCSWTLTYSIVSSFSLLCSKSATSLIPFYGSRCPPKLLNTRSFDGWQPTVDKASQWLLYTTGLHKIVFIKLLASTGGWRPSFADIAVSTCTTDCKSFKYHALNACSMARIDWLQVLIDGPCTRHPGTLFHRKYCYATGTLCYVIGHLIIQLVND